MTISVVPVIRDRFSVLSTVHQYNGFIREAVKQAFPFKALTLFRQMLQTGLEPNNLTFPFVAKACGKLMNCNYSRIIHTHVVKSPFNCDKYVQTALLDMYAKCDRLDDAHNVFEKMPETDLASWNAMLISFSHAGLIDRVANLFDEMRFSGVRPDAVTVMGLTQSISLVRDLRLLNVVHGFGIQIGVDRDVSVSNTWISAYFKCGDFTNALMVFNEIGASLRTIVSCNLVLSGYACSKEPFKAISFYKWMLLNDYRPDVVTIVGLLSSCMGDQTLFLGRSVHSHGVHVGCDSNIYWLNTLISMYSKCRDIDSARLVFDTLLDKSCVSWTCIIGAYVEVDDLDEALTLFHSMEVAGQKPDAVTMLHLISGCSRTGALETGRWLDRYMASNGLKTNVMVCNQLLDMYAKCGSIDEAHHLFDEMPEQTIVSWTTMIAGFALNGRFKEALEFFFRMFKFGIKPNHITFLAVLQACSHGGFLDEGWECYRLMTEVHRLSPELDHYSCMVDLLGRKGKIEEAFLFIQNMSVEPDAGIWGALLGACKNYGNLEIGEYAAYRLFELDPCVAAPYVELANMYASVGRWDGVSVIRKLMKENEVTKVPGQSIVQVNGRSHVFTVDDRSHPHGIIVYELLGGLALQLKAEKDSSLHLEELDESIDIT
ncbi:pentatricopeptide repeat-containing protein At4g19191, mitochondrial [Impatiens glandulifera]|uniref:pentatricopeptide repeat-containing protein At4g19191, mitochondrial n=1 Tax=Impatiens glandulifera TaxID=253017 RepID=UPI001FB0A241|nr:pentatricopeptide repeat-containing protein At4g19191, mitochondrial [Impatiens glandulifera]